MLRSGAANAADRLARAAPNLLFSNGFENWDGEGAP